VTSLVVRLVIQFQQQTIALVNGMEQSEVKSKSMKLYEGEA